MVYGHFALLLPEDEELFVYTRTLGEDGLLVLCNFSENGRQIDIPPEFEGAEALIGNYPTPAGPGTLRPWEALVLRRRG